MTTLRREYVLVKWIEAVACATLGSFLVGCRNNTSQVEVFYQEKAFRSIELALVARADSTGAILPFDSSCLPYWSTNLKEMGKLIGPDAAGDFQRNIRLEAPMDRLSW